MEYLLCGDIPVLVVYYDAPQSPRLWGRLLKSSPQLLPLKEASSLSLVQGLSKSLKTLHTKGVTPQLAAKLHVVYAAPLPFLHQMAAIFGTPLDEGVLQSLISSKEEQSSGVNKLGYDPQDISTCLGEAGIPLTNMESVFDRPAVEDQEAINLDKSIKQNDFSTISKCNYVYKPVNTKLLAIICDNKLLDLEQVPYKRHIGLVLEDSNFFTAAVDQVCDVGRVLLQGKTDSERVEFIVESVANVSGYAVHWGHFVEPLESQQLTNQREPLETNVLQSEQLANLRGQERLLKLDEGAECSCVIDSNHRLAVSINHTAMDVFYHALRKVLGE